MIMQMRIQNTFNINYLYYTTGFSISHIAIITNRTINIKNNYTDKRYLKSKDFWIKNNNERKVQCSKNTKMKSTRY